MMTFLALFRRRLILPLALLLSGIASAAMVDPALGQGCSISGPDVVSVGSSVQLCGPLSSDALYRWEGPNNFVASSRCVIVHIPGIYYLTVRSRSTGAEDQCSHRLDNAGADRPDPYDRPPGGCIITGPSTVAPGSSADLCAQSFTNSIYSWSGPGGFRSAMRCISVARAGTYTVGVRDRGTGEVRQCTFTLDVGPAQGQGGGGGGDGTDDGDAIVSDNCPRALGFWQQQCRRSADGRIMAPNDFTPAELRAIARRVDERSSYFNWTDDMEGFSQALNPPRPLTYRKQVARNQAALLANLSAGELNITTRSGDLVSLDPDTQGSFMGGASTIGELAALADRMLIGSRGSFARLSQALGEVNRGRGIGPVCP